MQGIGFIFLPKELEKQLDYNEFSKTIQQSESFAEEVEYIVLRNSKLKQLKDLLNRTNSIGSASFKYVNSLIMLTESGLYTAMILSRKPNAQKFRRWVTGEVLPSIRQTGIYKIPSSTDNSKLLSELTEKISSLEQICKNFAQIFTRQEQFQQHTVKAFERIEAALSESLSPDMFEGHKKIKAIVDDMTELYELSKTEKKKYIRELCQIHDIHLPEKAFTESEPLFCNIQEIAFKVGVYSATNKPHSRFIAALIRYLDLNRNNNPKDTTKYSVNVIPIIIGWLRDQGYPKIVKLGFKKGKVCKFQVFYFQKK